MSNFVFIATEGDSVPAGIWPARLTAIEEKQSKDGDTFRIWKFTAKIEDEFVEVTGASSLSNASNSKAFAWIKAILGREPEMGESITLDLLTAKTVNLIVVKDANGFGKIESLATFVPKKKAATAPLKDATGEAVGAVDLNEGGQATRQRKDDARRPNTDEEIDALDAEAALIGDL